MLNIISYQGNINQNDIEIALYTYQDGYNKEGRKEGEGKGKGKGKEKEEHKYW